MKRDKGNDSYGQPKSKYLTKISILSDKALEEAVEQMVWFSAWANNNRNSDYHWQADALYDECQKRNKPEIYCSGYKKAKAACE